MAPTSAAMRRAMERSTMVGSNVEMSTMLFPIVCATAVPKMNGPANSQTAAMIKAFLGERAPVAMMVATTFAASWKPLE